MILTAILMLGVLAPAFAADDNEALSEAVYACEAGENHDGEKISAEASKAACLVAIRLLTEIAEAK